MYAHTMKCPNCGSAVKLHQPIGVTLYEFYGAGRCPKCETRSTPHLAKLQIEKMRTFITREVFRAETAYEKRILIELSRVAQSYDLSFLQYHPKDNFGYGLIIDRQPVGYIAWNYADQGSLAEEKAGQKLADKTMVLRQFFIQPRFQRMGYGKLLLEVSAKDLGVDLNGEWAVEEPSEKMASFLVKHGYAEFDGDARKYRIIGKNIKFLRAGF